MTLRPHLYRYTGERKTMALGKGVHICEDCFALLVWTNDADTRKFVRAFIERAKDVYNSLVGVPAR